MHARSLALFSMRLELVAVLGNLQFPIVFKAWLEICSQRSSQSRNFSQLFKAIN